MDNRLSRTSFSAVAFAYFAALTVLFLGDALLDPSWIVSAPGMDVDQYFLPVRTFAFEQVRFGNLPLWNPYHLGGIPALGNFQYALFYPPNWVHLVLPMGLTINLLAAVHVMLAGLFTAAWCRCRGTSVIGSLLGGTIFMIGGPITMHIYAGYMTYLCVVAWSPLLFVCTDAIIESRRASRAAMWGAVVVAMQVLAGYPQPVYFTGMALGCYALVRLINRPGWKIATGWLVFMFVMGAALSAIQLLPGIDAALESNRGGSARYSFSTSFSFAPENLLTLFTPHPLGDGFHAPVFNRWGNVDTSVFVGVVGAFLALLAIVKSRTQHDWAFVVTIGLAFFIALGKYNPIFDQLLLIVPGLERMRFPSRFIFIISLLGAVLAGTGFDQIRRVRKLTLAALVAGFIATMLLLAGLVIAVTADQAAASPWGKFLTTLVATGETWPKLDKPDAADQIIRSAQLASSQFLAAGGAMLLITIIIVRLRRQMNWSYLLPILMLGELWVGSGLSWLRFRPPLLPPPNWQSAISLIGRDDRAVVMAGGQTNLTIPLQIESAGGYDPAVLARWDALVGPMLGSEPRTGNLEMRHLRPSVRWEMIRLGATLPHNDQIPVNPMPRLALIDRAKIVADPDESILAVREPDFDPWKTVILEQTPDLKPVQAAEPIGTASVIRLETDEIEITADLTRPAILLITDGYSHSWRARPLNPGPQQSYQVLPANHALRAIPLAAGAHHILLEYRPRAVAIGIAASIAAMVIWCGGWIVLRRKQEPYL